MCSCEGRSPGLGPCLRRDTNRLRNLGNTLPARPMTSEVQAAARAPEAAEAPQPTIISPSLFAFGIFYGGMVCIAGVLGNKQVALGPLAVEAGIFAFLFLVITSSAVAELHNRSIANRLVVLGFVPLIA